MQNLVTAFWILLPLQYRLQSPPELHVGMSVIRITATSRQGLCPARPLRMGEFNTWSSPLKLCLVLAP